MKIEKIAGVVVGEERAQGATGGGAVLASAWGGVAEAPPEGAAGGASA